MVKDRTIKGAQGAKKEHSGSISSPEGRLYQWVGSLGIIGIKFPVIFYKIDDFIFKKSLCYILYSLYSLILDITVFYYIFILPFYSLNTPFTP
jgi:hypothetical protein